MRIEYLEYLVDSGLQGLNRLFPLSFDNNKQKSRRTKYFLPTVEIKDFKAS